MPLTQKVSYVLLFSILCILARSHNPMEERICKHGEIEQNPGFHDVEEDMSALEDGRFLQSTNYSNIRIYPYFGFLNETASSDYAAYISNELVPPAVDYFQAALKVKYPVSGNLLISSSTICERTTPTILKSDGVPTDFFIYFDSELDDSTQIASTKYCYLASGSKRPLIARTMINRNQMTVANGDVLVHEKNMYVIMHEMTHAFGFSSSTYKYFLDSTGKTLTNPTKTVLIDGANRTVLDVAPLTDKLRNFYGCSSLQGAVLEDGGGSATDNSHFERKFFVYEYMSSGSIYGRRVSEFTLALLEGSGWYIPDYSYAEPFFYGQGQGCSFINSTCSSTSSQFDEFCVGSNRGCAPNGIAGGSCSSDSIMNGCKFYSPSKSYHCENGDAASNARLPTLQVFGRGAGSKCFTGTLSSSSSSASTSTSFCFKFSCSGTGTNTTLTLQLGSKNVTCAAEGTKTVSGYYGSINCPDPMTFCNTVGVNYCPKNCMGRGTCVSGKCQCKTGYTGTDCALKA